MQVGHSGLGQESKRDLLNEEARSSMQGHSGNLQSLRFPQVTFQVCPSQDAKGLSQLLWTEGQKLSPVSFAFLVLQQGCRGDSAGMDSSESELSGP